MKYGFIGCGNMGGAIAKALASKNIDLAVTDRSGNEFETDWKFGEE